MGFELVKTVTAPTPEGGFSKHFFYSTGTSPSGEQGMIAFWEIHVDSLEGYETNLNKGAGLPWWAIIWRSTLPPWPTSNVIANVGAATVTRCSSRSRILSVDLHPRPRGQHGRVLPRCS